MPYASSHNRSAVWPRLKLVGEVLYHQIERDRLFTQASALTYKTLFSLLPIFVLSLLILSTISKDDFGFKQTIYEQFGIDNMNFKDDTGATVSLQNTADKIITSRSKCRLDARDGADRIRGAAVRGDFADGGD